MQNSILKEQEVGWRTIAPRMDGSSPFAVQKWWPLLERHDRGMLRCH